MSLPKLTQFFTKLEASHHSDIVIAALKFITSVALFTSLQVGDLVSKSATAYDPFNTILIEGLTFTQCLLTLDIGAIDTDSPNEDYVVLLPLDSIITCPVKAASNLKSISTQRGLWHPLQPISRIDTNSYMTTEMVDSIMEDILSQGYEWSTHIFSANCLQADTAS